MLRCPRGIHSFRLMTAANRRALLRSSRRLAPRPCSSALLGRESHAASLGAFQPMSPISGSFAVRALSSSSHVGESIAQGSPAMGKIHNAKREERPKRGGRDNQQRTSRFLRPPEFPNTRGVSYPHPHPALRKFPRPPRSLSHARKMDSCPMSNIFLPLGFQLSKFRDDTRLILFVFGNISRLEPLRNAVTLNVKGVA